jgi:hypothetical protein
MDFPFFNILGTKKICGFPTKWLIESIGIRNWFILGTTSLEHMGKYTTKHGALNGNSSEFHG